MRPAQHGAAILARVPHTRNTAADHHIQRSHAGRCASLTRLQRCRAACFSSAAKLSHTCHIPTSRLHTPAWLHRILPLDIVAHTHKAHTKHTHTRYPRTWMYPPRWCQRSHCGDTCNHLHNIHAREHVAHARHTSHTHDTPHITLTHHTSHLTSHSSSCSATHPSARRAPFRHTRVSSVSDVPEMLNALHNTSLPTSSVKNTCPNQLRNAACRST